MKPVFIFLSLLFIHNVYADPIYQNITSGCDTDNLNTVNNIANLLPAFSPSVYTCSSGQFLPADTTGCQTCPSGYTCPGGDMTFNENNLSGLNEANIVRSTQNTCSANFLHANNNNVANLIPVFEISSYNCAPGTYLPANTDECRPCLKDNKCIGGTYSFNETTTQGIEPCPSSAPHAPTGSAICYEHILHIGDDTVYLKSTKLTTPSLNIGIDDKVFYANMTTTPTTMSRATEHYLKMLVNGAVYYVCDDSTYDR